MSAVISTVVRPKNYQHSAVCHRRFFNDDSTLEYQQLTPGEVQALLIASDKTQGYDGVMHGGVVSTLHDSAMAHSLFALEVSAMTAELTVRFIKPVPLNTELTVTARRVKLRKNVHYLESEIRVNGVICSSACGKFISARPKT